jgi:hypothetical protein
VAETLLSEDDVLAQWPALSKCGLRAARQAHKIGWVRGKRGSAWYRPSAIETFISEELEQPCRAHAQEPSLNSAANGLPKNLGVLASTVSGMTLEMEERAAQASALRILKKPKVSLPK